MQRRKFLNWVSGGIGLAVGSRYLIPSRATSENLAEGKHPVFRFAALGDVGTGKAGQMAIAGVMNDYYRQHPLELVLMTEDNICEGGASHCLYTVYTIGTDKAMYAIILTYNHKTGLIA